MMDDMTLDEAVALLAEKGKVLKPRGAANGKTAAGEGRQARRDGAGCPKAAARRKAAAKAAAKTGPKRRSPSAKPSRPRRRPRRARPPPSRRQAEDCGAARRPAARKARASPAPGPPSRKRSAASSATARPRRQARDRAPAWPPRAAHQRGAARTPRDLADGGSAAPARPAAAAHRRSRPPAGMRWSCRSPAPTPMATPSRGPVGWEGEGPPPLILMAPEPRGRPALAPGERVLARLRPIGARAATKAARSSASTDTPGRVLGVFRAGPRRRCASCRPTGAPRPNGWSRRGEDGGAEPGEIVLAEPLPHAGARPEARAGDRAAGHAWAMPARSA